MEFEAQPRPLTEPRTEVSCHKAVTGPVGAAMPDMPEMAWLQWAIAQPFGARIELVAKAWLPASTRWPTKLTISTIIINVKASMCEKPRWFFMKRFMRIISFILGSFRTLIRTIDSIAYPSNNWHG